MFNALYDRIKHYVSVAAIGSAPVGVFAGVSAAMSSAVSVVLGRFVFPWWDSIRPSFDWLDSVWSSDLGGLIVYTFAIDHLGRLVNIVVPLIPVVLFFSLFVLCTFAAQIIAFQSYKAVLKLLLRIVF